MLRFHAIKYYVVCFVKVQLTESTDTIVKYDVDDFVRQLNKILTNKQTSRLWVVIRISIKMRLHEQNKLKTLKTPLKHYYPKLHFNVN